MFEGEYYRLEMEYINDKYDNKKADVKNSNHKDLYLSKYKTDGKIKCLNEWFNNETKRNMETIADIKAYNLQKNNIKKEYTTRLKQIKSAFKWFNNMIKTSEKIRFEAIEKERQNAINIFKKQYYEMKYNQNINKEPTKKHDINEKIYFEIKYKEYMDVLISSDLIDNDKKTYKLQTL